MLLNYAVIRQIQKNFDRVLLDAGLAQDFPRHEIQFAGVTAQRVCGNRRAILIEFHARI